MNKRKRQLERDLSSGFTLIEILLVVVIIGILAAVAVPRFSGRTEQAKTTAAKSSIAALGVALDMYEIDNGEYPSSLQALVTQPGGAQNWRGPYLKEGLPNDPWGNPFIYQHPGSHNAHGYDLSCSGSESGEVIGNWKTTSN